MRRGVPLLIVILLAAATWSPAQRGRGREKPKGRNNLPELEIIELKVHREEKAITLDGRVRNISAKPMKGVEIGRAHV